MNYKKTKDIFSFRDNDCIHCKTEKEAIKLKNFFLSIGYKLINGAIDPNSTGWDIHKENTIYYILTGQFEDIQNAHRRNATIYTLKNINFNGEPIREQRNIKEKYLRSQFRRKGFVFDSETIEGVPIKKIEEQIKVKEQEVIDLQNKLILFYKEMKNYEKITELFQSPTRVEYIRSYEF